MKDMELKIEYMALDQLTPYENNAKIHTPEQIEQIKASIRDLGMNDPIAVSGADNIIVEGHGRLIACRELGMETVPVIRLDHLNDEQRKAYTLIHNKLTMNTDFDLEKLNAELQVINLDMAEYGFIDIDEPEALNLDGEIEEDAVPEPPAEPKSKLGEIYKLGEHRLMCGDSTSPENVAKLMDGRKADMIFTDPPYGVDYQGINNDDRKGLKDLLDKAFDNMLNNSKAGASVYCFHSDRCADIFHNVFRKYCHFSSMIIWEKPSLTLSQTDYQSIHEPCLYGWFNNGTHSFYGDRKQISVWEFERDGISEHTTPKPIKLICKALANSSKKRERVLDLFGGSGSTIIACEQLGRKCCMMELDPRYVDVIIERWEKLTGQKAIKIKEAE